MSPPRFKELLEFTSSARYVIFPRWRANVSAEIRVKVYHDIKFSILNSCELRMCARVFSGLRAISESEDLSSIYLESGACKPTILFVHKNTLYTFQRKKNCVLNKFNFRSREKKREIVET